MTDRKPDLQLFLGGKVVAKGRARTATRKRSAAKGGGTWIAHITPPATENYEKAIKAEVLRILRAPLSGPLWVKVIFYIAPPRSWSKKAQAAAVGTYVVSKPDLDNYVKIFDGLNEVAWHDDSQIVKLQAVKKYSEAPGMALQIFRL